MTDGRPVEKNHKDAEKAGAKKLDGLLAAFLSGAFIAGS